MGHVQLEGLFPGITGDLRQAGAQLGTGTEVKYYIDGRLKPPVDLPMVSATRPLLENVVRSRVLELPNVMVTQGRAQALHLDERSVRSVRYAAQRQEAPQSTNPSDLTDIDADFVVDCMGRSSRLGTWLLDAGWSSPPLDRMRIDLGYATARFHRGSELPGTVIVHSTPGPASDYLFSRCEPGAMSAVEENSWAVALAGYGNQRPGTCPEEFVKRMKRCVAPLHEVAERCEMAGSVETFHFREGLRRKFTRLNRFPGGLIALGDSAASVNPIYGQGLTLAVLQASCLGAYLRSGLDPHAPARTYFDHSAVFVEAAWGLSTAADLAQPHVDGHRSWRYRLTRILNDKIIAASITDPEVNRAFMRVLNMRDHPRSLLSPGVLLRSARSWAGSTG
ncbi:hypothetical protein AB0P17_24300 [Streptomyces sp. NPDC088124]|uniref:hypothetical protein n=1 Tax=Streptomyces sp. NPDC088124 TaxID=3154654 RepID=UPI0034354BFB